MSRTTKPATVGNALRLSLGGAPSTWHVVGDISGMFHPDIPTPLSLLGVDAETAQAWHDEQGMPLELVTISEKDAEANAIECRVQMGETRDAIAASLRERGIASEEERERIAAQVDATAPAITDTPDRSES